MKRRKEKITIILTDEVKDKSMDVDKVKDFYLERTRQEANPLNDFPTYEGKVDKIIHTIELIEKKQEEISKSYYILKIFGKSVKKDEMFNKTILSLDKDVNQIKRTFEEQKKKTKNLENSKDTSFDELYNIFQEEEELLAYIKNVETSIKTANDKYYRNLKVASLSICNSKKSKELETIYYSINLMYEEYKSIEKAYDYVHYNSGELIVSTVNSFLNCLKSTNINELQEAYPLNYFLKSDYVITLEYREWVDLISKIRYVMRIARKVDMGNYIDFNQKYQELEKRYFIILLMNEIINNK